MTKHILRLTIELGKNQNLKKIWDKYEQIISALGVANSKTRKSWNYLDNGFLKCGGTLACLGGCQVMLNLTFIYIANGLFIGSYFYGYKHVG